MIAFLSLVPPIQCSGPAAPPAAVGVEQTDRYMEQGNTFFNQGAYEKSIAEYTAAIGVNPKLAVAYWSRGRAYFFAGKGLSAAVDDYTKAIELDAAFTKAYYYRGLANAANGGYERAAADFNKTIELDKTIPRAYFLRAWCNAYKAQWDQSSQLYLYQLFESDAGLMEAYKGLGWVYIRQPLWQYFAVPDPIKITEQDPPISDVYMDRGFVHFKKAQWAQAIADLDKAYAFDKGLNRNAWNKDWAISKNAQWDTVIIDYEKAIELISRQPSQSIKSGTLKEELAQAIGDYNKAAELSQDAASIQKAKDSLKFIDDFTKAIAK
jgi:tetratricopeptide (TPR) repeat protein